MGFSSQQYPLAFRALNDMVARYHAQDLDFTAEDYARSWRKLEIIDQYIDRAPEEKDNLMVLAIVLYGGAKVVSTIDPEMYREKYNEHVYKMLREAKDGKPPTKDHLQAETVAYIRLLEYYRDKIRKNPRAFAGRQASFKTLQACPIGDPPPVGPDHGMPSLTAYARQVREELKEAVRHIPSAPAYEMY